MRRATDEEKAMAARLKADGYSYGIIADMFGRHRDVIRYWVDPRVKKRLIKAVQERRKRGFAIPKPPPMTPAERRYRSRTRAAARIEAAKTGEPVQAIYERWGVS